MESSRLSRKEFKLNKYDTFLSSIYEINANRSLLIIRNHHLHLQELRDIVIGDGGYASLEEYFKDEGIT